MVDSKIMKLYIIITETEVSMNSTLVLLMLNRKNNEVIFG
jgi:hypothetical protein